jgi:hypothetical protein
MAARRYYDGEAVRMAILACAVPGKLLPLQVHFAKLLDVTPAMITYHLNKLRDEWRIVTKYVVVGRSRRILVVSV